jgi:hypothetical protein
VDTLKNNKFSSELSKCLEMDLKHRIIDLLTSCYGVEEIETRMGFKISELEQGSDEILSELLSIYSGNEELKNPIWRVYSDFGYTLKKLGISATRQKDLMDGWDDKSKAILWYLYQRRYANIAELGEFVCASHYEVLSRLNEVIIPESRKILGKPIVKFEQSKMDTVSGNKVCFSWWIADERPALINNLEMLHESERILIIVNLPNAKLPDQPDASARFKNGVLEIAIKK